MPTGLLADIIDRLPRRGRLLGMDLGDRTIGLAVSDDMHKIATPLRTLNRTKFTRDMQDMANIVKDYEITGFVMGYPLNMDGSAGKRCDVTRSFADQMARCADVAGEAPWIALWDERLSTVSVEDFLIESVDMSRTKRKQVVDKLAAQHILQGALDFIQAARVEKSSEQP